jgi:uncharacterized SAM-dependent methyltransferase
VTEDNIIDLDVPYADRLTVAALACLTGKKHGNLDFIAYESAKGAEFFANFSQHHADYYPFHGEIDHIQDSRGDLIASKTNLAETDVLVIVGQGPWENCLKKEGQIIRDLARLPKPRLQKVVFIDISSDFNEQARQGMDALKKELNRPDLQIETHTADFQEYAMDHVPAPNTTVISTGSLISNITDVPLSGFPEKKLQSFLQSFRDIAGPSGKVVLGYDGNRDSDSNISAYEGSGDLSKFFYNVIWEIHSKSHGVSLSYTNDDGEQVPLDQDELMDGKIFRYIPVWNEQGGHVAHTLEFLRPVTVSVDLSNPALCSLLSGREKATLRNGLTFTAGQQLVAMTSTKYNWEDVKKAGKEVNLDTLSAKFHSSGLCLHSFKTIQDKADLRDERAKATKGSKNADDKKDSSDPKDAPRNVMTWLLEPMPFAA